jgi:hypothetical protein
MALYGSRLRLAGAEPDQLTLAQPEFRHIWETVMSWIGVLLAFIGAALILGALTYVTLLIGGLINGMIVLMCGPLIDRMVARRRRPAA